MKINLDQIENGLQKLIENSSALLSWRDSSKPVAHRLVLAMFEFLEKEKPSTRSNQILFTIFLPSESYLLWKDNLALLSSLSDYLQQTASREGYIFSAAPVLRVSLNEQLRPHDVEVMVSNSLDAPQQTSVMETEDASPSSQLPVNAFLIVNGTDTFPLTGSVINIGRRENNHLILDDPRVSRNHAQLRAVHGKYILFDLNSTGGTYVNGLRIYQQNLQAGDVISFAGVAIVYGEDNSTVEAAPEEDTSPGLDTSGDTRGVE